MFLKQVPEHETAMRLIAGAWVDGICVVLAFIKNAGAGGWRDRTADTDPTHTKRFPTSQCCQTQSDQILIPVKTEKIRKVRSRRDRSIPSHAFLRPQFLEIDPSALQADREIRF